MIRDRETAIARLASRVHKDPAPGCWFFQGGHTNGGYGRMSVEGVVWPTHRLSYTLHVGPIPEGMVLDHLCHNKACANPEHLEPVTTAENTRRGIAAWLADPCVGHPKWPAMRRPGSGSITKRGDSWRLCADAGPDPITGKRRQVRRTVRGSRKDAEQAMARMLVEAGRGGYLGHDATIGQLLDAWFASARLAPSTRVDRRSALKHVTPGIRATPVWKLRTHDLDALYAHLERQGLQPARIRTVHSVLRSALSQAVRWQWITRNPAADAAPPPVGRARVTAPSADDVRRLLAAADGQLDAYLRVSANLGARRGEVCALQWSDIDLDGCQATIRRAWSDGGKGVGMVLKSTKTGRERTVALDRTVVATLRSWSAEQARYVLETGVTRGPWVFGSDPAGVTSVRPDAMTHQFAALRSSLGLEHVVMRNLRHFVATQLLAAGVDPRTVAGRLGHARTSTTLDIYAAWVPARDQEAADVLGRLLG